MIGFVLLTCTTTTAQQPGQSAPPGSWPTGITTWDSVYGVQNEAAKLAKDFTKSTKPDEKQEIRKKLSDLLTKQFDTNVQHQQKELEELEKQIADLRTLLKKRQDAKSTIVERRLEQLIQDAEGLGWTAPGTTMPRGMMGGGGLGNFRPITQPAPAGAAPKAPEAAR
jgi:hypothetical protein